MTESIDIGEALKTYVKDESPREGPGDTTPFAGNGPMDFLRPQASAHPRPRSPSPVQFEGLNLEIEVDPGDACADRSLGHGAFGAVETAAYVDENGVRHQVAVKYADSLEEGKAHEALHNELRVFSAVGHHPNVIRCFGGRLNCGSRRPGGARLCVVLELMQRNLADYLYSPEFEECTYRTSLKMCLDLAEGLMWLHSKNIIHYDLKPQNILLAEDMTAKIADFGESQLRCARTITAEFRGTQNYMAPEIQMSRYYNKLRGTKKADIFSFGVILWECVTAKRPPSPEDVFLGKRGTRRGEVRIGTSLLTVGEGCPTGIVDLIARCTDLLIDKRPTSEEIRDELEALLTEPWVDNLILPTRVKPSPKEIQPAASSSERNRCTGEAKIETAMLAARRDLTADELRMRGLALSEGPFSAVEQAVYTDCEGERHDVLVKFARHPCLWRCFKDELDSFAQVPGPQHGSLARCFGGKVGTVDWEDDVVPVPGQVFIVEEMYDMSLDHLIHQDYSIRLFKAKEGRVDLDGSKLLAILADVADGLAHLHAHGIIHYFVCPRNIRVDRSGGAKVGGFHLSSLRTKATCCTSDCSEALEGYDLPVGYMAPELVLSNYDQTMNITSKVDVYSLGVVMWEVATLKDPPGKAGTTTFGNASVVNSATCFGRLFQLDDGVPEKLRTLIQDCLKYDPAERPTCSEAKARLEGVKGNTVWKLVPDDYELPSHHSDGAIALHFQDCIPPALAHSCNLGLGKRQVSQMQSICESDKTGQSTTSGSSGGCALCSQSEDADGVEQRVEITGRRSAPSELFHNILAKTLSFCWRAFPAMRPGAGR
ncbi:unnamed protein product [Ostreobium quekettii]|uniref:Protein kinase domain-containing protein n=1 Tax=Ostreobium quekettii TaxID=121088 RepID=A0A8S1JA46_9CHLO|nr:unnamed protein product [Ostreobium quekettii]|eukprot:evm.model.scf_1375.3 EVM.evm.TU.scf_1375.3   scf_1375:17730-20201(-)